MHIVDIQLSIKDI